MKTFSINVLVTVPAYATLQIEAETPEAALAIVQADLEANGFESKYWQEPTNFETDWSSAENLMAEIASTQPNEVSP